MAYVEGFEHDVFVSYAHVDNQPRGGDPKGWVTKLREEIEAAVGQFGVRDFSLFMDYEDLVSNLPLGDQLMSSIGESAVLLMVLSPAYVVSPWCERENTTFLETHSLKSGRLFVAERLPPDSFPPQLEGLLGVRFWTGGEPPQVLSPFVSSGEFRTAVDKLGYDLVKQLKKMKAAGGPAGKVEPVSAPSGREAGETRATVFLAEVPRHLDPLRNQVKTFLSGYGVEVVPPDYYQEAGEDLRAKLREDLKSGEIFVQLLGESEDPRARMQFDCAVEAGKRMFVWRDPAMALETVGDDEYREFLKVHPRCEALNTFQKAVKDEVLKPPPPPPPVREDSFVYVHMDDADPSLADAVLRELQERQVWSELLSAETAREVDEGLKAELPGSSALIIVRGSNDKWLTATWGRMRKILPGVMKQRREAGRPDLPIALYEPPPGHEAAAPITGPNLHVLDCSKGTDELNQFLDRLLGGAA